MVIFLNIVLVSTYTNKKTHEVIKMPSIDEAIKNLESALSDLKAILVQEEILVQSEESEELVNNQDPEAIAAYNARKFMDIRF